MQIANHPQFSLTVDLTTPTDSVPHRFVFESQLSCLLILEEIVGQPVLPVDHDSDALLVIVHEGSDLSIRLNDFVRFELELSVDKLFIEHTHLFVDMIFEDQCTLDL